MGAQRECSRARADSEIERAHVLLVFSQWKGMSWKGIGLMHETGIVVAVLWGLAWASAAYVANKGDEIRHSNAGYHVRVTLSGDNAPLPQTARLLGSSNAFVFLWWPQQKMAEAMPIESIARLQSLPRRRDGQTAPAKPAKPAATAPAAAR